MKLSKAFLLLVIFVTLSAVHLAIFTNSSSIGYQINKIKKDLDKIKSENRYLNYRVAKTESLPRIEQISKNKLGMSYPKNITYIVIKDTTAEASER